MRRNIIIIAVLCVCIFASCCSIRHLDIPHQEDYTQFDNGEHLTLISLYEISDDSFCDTIQTGFCLIEGQICVRDGIERYSGEPFDKFYYIIDLQIPKIAITDNPVCGRTRNINRRVFAFDVVFCAIFG